MKHFYLKSWEEYQHGSGKTREYPWIKLYGSLFRRHWFIEMTEEFRYWTICLLDYSRENNNRNPLNLETFFRIYHLKFCIKKSKTWFNYLISKDFIASKMLAECYQDASSNREEENREEKSILDNNHKQACDEELPLVIEKPKKQIPLWKTDFEVYYKNAKDSLIELLDDKTFISERERYHDGLDIALTLEKSFNDYWGTTVGWDKKKKSKTDVIDWKRTYNNALTLKGNKVWKKINKEVFK